MKQFATIYLINGTSVSGYIKKYNKKTCKLKADNGNILVINKPRKNILMVKWEKKTIIQPTNEIPKEAPTNLQPPKLDYNVEVGQYWLSPENERWHVIDVVYNGQEYLAFLNLHTETISISTNLMVERGWQYLSDSFAEPELKEEDHNITRIKKIQQTKQEDKKTDLNQIKSILSNSNLPKAPNNYGSIFLNK